MSADGLTFDQIRELRDFAFGLAPDIRMTVSRDSETKVTRLFFQFHTEMVVGITDAAANNGNDPLPALRAEIKNIVVNRQAIGSH